MVLLFHQGWLGGGYVGVSVFFTLSGYLITSLALVEHDRTGRLDVGAFYGRRLRRLLPASLACLAAIVVLAALGLFDGVEHLRRDLYGALAQVYNWVALSSGQTYAELVAGGGGRSCRPSTTTGRWRSRSSSTGSGRSCSSWSCARSPPAPWCASSPR